MRFLPLAAVIFSLTAGTAHGGDAVRVTAVPIPSLVQGEAAGALGDPIQDSPTAVGDSLVYANTNYSAGFIYNAGAGVMFADDIHLTLPGRLTQFYFLFTEPEPNPVRFTMAFYANDATDAGVGELRGGPFAIGPIRGGTTYFVHVTVTDTLPVLLDRDAWFAASIATPTAGLALADPPFVGASHDLYYDWGLGRVGHFAGAAANFYLRVFVEPEPLPVTETSWSAVKALFRPGAPVPAARRE